MTKRDSGILELFGSLGDLDVATRVKTTTQLIKALQAKQQGQQTPSEDLNYALKRLVRGLSSYRDGARQGFALGLTEVLHTFAVVSVREVLTLIKDNLTVPGSATGPEERDVLFGQVFGLLAIIRSGRLVQPGSRAAAAATPATKGSKTAVESDAAADVVQRLLQLADKKSFLAEIAHQAIITFLSQIEKKFFEEHILPVILERVKADANSWSPELLTLVIHLNELFQLNVSEHNGKWSSKNGGRIVQVDNIKHLKQICKQSVYVHPKIHSLWDTLLPRLCSEKSEKDVLSKFWNEVVEGELFTATHNTQYLAYQLVEQVLAHASAEQVPVVLTRAFIRRMLKESSGSIHLQAVAKQTVTALAPLARRGSEVSLAVLMQLAAASKQFDFFTKTRTTTDLMKALDVKEVHTFTEYLKDMFYGDKQKAEKRKEKEAGGAESSRLWALNKLNEMARARGVHKDEKWFLSLLRFCFYHAFYAPQSVDKIDGPVAGLLKEEGLLRVPSPPLSGKTRSLCGERFLVLLGEVATLPPLGQRENRKAAAQEDKADQDADEEEEDKDHHRNPFFDGQCADGELWVWKIAHFHTQLSASAALRFVPQLSKEAKQLQAQILDVAQAIHKTEQQRLKKGEAIEKDANAARARGFAILLLFLHTYVIHDNELVGALEDLLECWKRIDAAQAPAKGSSSSTKDKRKSKDAMEVEQGEEPEPMAVLVDILISFLTKASSQLRDLVTRTFRLFASQMTSSSCQALVEVVTGKRDSTLFGIEDEDDEEEVEEDEDEHDDDDDDDHGKKDDDDEESDDEDEEESSDDDDDDEEEEESKADTSLDTSKHKSSDSEEEEEEEEELLDDAAMFKMDEKIVAVLKNMKEKKTNERDARESVKHFKCRVLDLLEIFVKRQHDSHLIPEMIGPLAAAVRDSAQSKHQQELSTKLAGFLKRLFKSKHYPKGVAQTEYLHDLLGTFVERAMHTKSLSADLFSGGIFYIVKILLAGKPSRDYKTSSFFERVKAAHEEEEAERAKKAAEEKEKRAAAGEPEKKEEGQKKRKRGDTKTAAKAGGKKGKKDEELDEATLLRKTIVRRYRKNSLPKDTTNKMLGGLDVDRAMYLLRIAMRDFMTRNSTRIEPHFFLHFSQNFPKLSWMLMPDYLSYVTLARSAFLKQHIFVILSDLLKRPEAIGENGEGVVSVLPQIREAFVAILKAPPHTALRLCHVHGLHVLTVVVALARDATPQDQKKLKPDYVVAMLQCLKQVVDVLLEKAKQEPAKVKAELFAPKESKKPRVPEQARKSLQEVLDALIEARRASQAICGHASKLYHALALALPNELQKSQLSKQDRKKQRREEKKKRQEERDRKRFEKLAQKKLKYQLLAQQEAAGGGAAPTEAAKDAMDTESTSASATPTSTPTTPRKDAAAANGGGKKAKKSNGGGAKKKGGSKINKKKQA